MDTYQAVYDATRSRLSNGDIGEAVHRAVVDVGLSHYAMQVAEEFKNAAYEQQRPCVLMRPTISIDGNQWCALYGENLQEGVCGFGDTPELAMRDFDTNWHNESPIALVKE